MLRISVAMPSSSATKIGRASCRGRGENSGGGGLFKKKKNKKGQLKKCNDRSDDKTRMMRVRSRPYYSVVMIRNCTPTRRLSEELSCISTTMLNTFGSGQC